MRKTILIVDDDEMNLRMAEFILKQQPYEILKAQSGKECLEILQNKQVDLVLLDIEMPFMNGIKTLEIMRENEKLEHVPVMFLTAAADSATVTEAGRLGAIDYVKKPFMPQDLLGRVEKVFA